MSAPSPADIFLLAFVGFFFLRGLLRGTLRELFSLIALGAAFWAAVHHSGFAEAQLRAWAADPGWLGVASRALTFLAVWAAAGLAGRLVCFIARPAPMGPADRAGGGLVGAAKGVFLAAAAAAALEAYDPALFPAPGEGVRAIPYVRQLGGHLRGVAFPPAGEGPGWPAGAAAPPAAREAGSNLLKK